MRIDIPTVDVGAVQLQIDTQIGEGIFMVNSDKSTTPKQCYFECDDSTPQNLIDQATTIANDEAVILFNATRVRLYDSLITIANRQITIIEKPYYTDEDIALATAWLNDQTLPVPACVTYTALNFSLTNQEAAQKIVDSKSTYDALIQQIRTLQAEGQAAVLAATDTYSAKIAGTDYMDQIKNVT